MRNIEDIIEDIIEYKMHGIDCTEESAEIKEYIREQIKLNHAISYDIQYWFTQEYMEVLEDNNILPVFIKMNNNDETT